MALAGVWIVSCSAIGGCSIGLPASPGAKAFGSGCAERFETEPFADLFEDLERAGAVAPVWPGYRIEDQDLVLESLDSSSGGSCVAHRHRGALRQIAHSRTRLEGSLGFFGFLITERADGDPAKRMGFLVGGLPSRILGSLRRVGAGAALVWTGDGRTLESAGLPTEREARRRLVRYLVLHEAAHVRTLMGPVFAPGWSPPRPEWQVQADEETLLHRCLQDPSAAAERERLADAVASLEDDDADAASDHLEAFATLRADRYRRLASVRVSAGDGEALPCWLAEAVWELDEGGADFIALGTLRKAGLALPLGGSLAEHLRGDRSNEPYYATGASQLFLLRGLTDADPIFAELSTADSATGALWCQVARLTGVPAEECSPVGADEGPRTDAEGRVTAAPDTR